MSSLIALLGLSAGFHAGPMAIKPTVCATKPVTMMAGASLGEEAAKKAWLANNPASYGPKAGKPGAKRGGAPVRTAAAIVAASKAAWNEKHHSASPAGMISAMYYRKSAFGDNSPGVRPVSPQVASSEGPVAWRNALAPPAIEPPKTAAPGPSTSVAGGGDPNPNPNPNPNPKPKPNPNPNPNQVAGGGGDEAAAKAAWLAKLDAPAYGPNKGRKAASTRKRKSSTYRNPSMGDNKPGDRL